MQTTEQVLFIIPPFTQMNTPYPSTAYLKGFLNTKQIPSRQIDLSLEVILCLFSMDGLSALFEEARKKQSSFSANSQRIFALQTQYIHTIDRVIRFLQGKDDTLAMRLSEPGVLPEAGRFACDEEEMEWAFGTMGHRDKARYRATLYLEDLSDFIRDTVDPDFGFSRYAEHLGRCASSFDDLYKKLSSSMSFTDHYLLHLLDRQVRASDPRLIAISIPFPGNLYSALRCAQWIKKKFPDKPVVCGGGFVSTELRSVADRRLFEFVDYLLLDDGEDALLQLIRYLDGTCPQTDLVRTFMLDKRSKQVSYFHNPDIPSCAQSALGTPDYEDLPLDNYLSVIDVINPMHKLWSDGRWNKLTLAHGCYWGKCSFCDGSLDYIGRYQPNKVRDIADRIEQIITQTGTTGFHFVDEAAPPSLLKELAIELLRRNTHITWWGNIRFEKSFTPDLCRLLKASGCIAVSGGLEVASPRLLKLINKGVTLQQVAQVTDHFTSAGIMVHAYLMYGFPTQTAQETIDSLEIVRQMFENGLIQSGFWHRFALTAHSPVGLHPEKFHIRIIEPAFGGFARNDIRFEDPSGCRHEVFSEGLRISLFNYMRGIGLDYPLHKWFESKVPRTTIPPNFIAQQLTPKKSPDNMMTRQLYWLGNLPQLQTGNKNKPSLLTIHTNTEELHLKFPAETAQFVADLLVRLSGSPLPIQTVKELFDQKLSGDFSCFLYSHEISVLKENGLYLL